MSKGEKWKGEMKVVSKFDELKRKKMHFEKQTNSSFWINVNEHI